MFDGDMQSLLGVQCSTLVSAAKAENGGFYPAEMAKLKGRSMLFRVEMNASVSVMYDGSFRVKRVCVDPEIISEFADTVEDCPLEKDGLDDVDGDGGDLGEDVEVVQETQDDVIAANVVAQTASPRLSPVEFKNVAAEVEVAPPGLGRGPIHLGDDFGCVDHDGVPGVEGSRKKRSLKSVSRNLAKDFDGIADEGYGVVTPLAKRVVKGVKKSYEK